MQGLKCPQRTRQTHRDWNPEFLEPVSGFAGKWNWIYFGEGKAIRISNRCTSQKRNPHPFLPSRAKYPRKFPPHGKVPPRIVFRGWGIRVWRLPPFAPLELTPPTSPLSPLQKWVDPEGFTVLFAAMPLYKPFIAYHIHIQWGTLAQNYD